MRSVLLVFVTALFFCCTNKSSHPQKSERFVIRSQITGDSYNIQIRKPLNSNVSDSFHLIYAVDGSIGIGNYLAGKDSSWSATLPDNCIVITIGHIGDWHTKRRRDFIPSDISKDSIENFGHADKFYFFLKNELLPLIDKKNINSKSKSFVGHSFGGLFCLYTALKNDKLFDNYFAISPSVWANYYELLKIEKGYAETNSDLSANISIYAGSLEVFNKVLSSSKEFYDSLNIRNYKNLNVNFSVINNANHFSIRKPVVDKILIYLKEK